MEGELPGHCRGYHMAYVDQVTAERNMAIRHVGQDNKDRWKGPVQIPYCALATRGGGSWVPRVKVW